MPRTRGKIFSVTFKKVGLPEEMRFLMRVIREGMASDRITDIVQGERSISMRITGKFPAHLMILLCTMMPSWTEPGYQIEWEGN